MTRRWHAAVPFTMLALALLLGAAPREAAQQAIQDALEQGHWAEALQMARLRLESGQATPDDLDAAVRSLRQLGRLEGFDKLVEDATDRYASDPAMLLAAGQAYARTSPYGYEVEGAFLRGNQRGGRSWRSVEEADRVRALRLAARVVELVGEGQSDVGYAAAELLAEQLLQNRNSRRAWRLQLLTDLDGDLPEPAERWGNNASESDPPVAADGELPLLYDPPASWEAAQNDGERWRWALEKQKQFKPRSADKADRVYANFLREQFGVQTLARQGWFLPRDENSPSVETSALAVETLDDSETIARLATGVRRFTLPEGHRFIEMFHRLGEWSTLHRTYLDRNQRPKAADALRQRIENTTDSNTKRSLADQLDQIVAPWLRFESQETETADSGARLRVRHRNAGQLRFEAKPVDVKRLLADVREALTEAPKNVNRRELNVEQLGWRLVNGKAGKYLGETAAEWTLAVEEAADHRDSEVSVTTPLQTPGAYLVTATPLGADGEPGAETNVVVWVADTVLVSKPTPGGTLYQLLDASDGLPIEGGTIDLFGYRQVQDRQPNRAPAPLRLETTRVVDRTNAEGLAVIDTAPGDGERPFSWLAIATTETGRLAHLGFDRVWRRYRNSDPPSNPRTFLVTDRPVYRPGDAVEFRAWIGRPDYANAVEGDSAEPSEYAHQEFQVDIYDARGEKVSSERLTADALGGLTGQYLTTEADSLGAWRIDVVGFGVGSFRVEEYRKPEFEVFVDAPKEPTTLGDAFEAKVRAAYYAGTPVRVGSVKYKVVRTRRTDRWLPPGPWDWLYGRGYGWLGQDASWRRDWTRWGCPGPLPWWWSRPGGPPEVIAEGEATLDDGGQFLLEIDTALAQQRQPDSDHDYKITAEVTDAGRRTVTGAGSVLAARRPADVTVWLDRGFYEVGDTVRANVSVRRPDGVPIAGDGELRLLKIAPPTAEQPRGAEGAPIELIDPEETLVQSWDLGSDAGGAADLRLKASEPGRYRLVYRSAVGEGDVEGGVLFTIRGPGFDGGDFRFGALEIVPDKAEYAPGETVRLMVNTDRAGAGVSLFVRPVGGVYETPRVLRMEGKSTVVELPVLDGDMPNFFVEAVTVADGKLHNVARRIVVPPESRVLEVEASPSASTYLPGEEGKLRVRLTDARGEPVVGQATIAVYDRSVEAIAGGPSGGDIRSRFWEWTRQHSPNTTHNLARAEWPVARDGVPTMQSLGVFGEIVPRRDAVTRGVRGGEFGRGGFGGGAFGGPVPMAAPMSLGVNTAAAAAPEAMAFEADESADASGKLGGADGEVAVRENFADTALWIGSIETDADGLAEIAMPLPESLTSWKIRVWSVASGVRVGQGEAEVTTRKDLMVRLRAPRFLVDGDEATFAAVVQNESSRDLEVGVRLEADGDAVTVSAAAVRTVAIRAGGEALVDWPVSATAEGEATVRVVARSTGDDPLSDAMRVTLPVLVHGAERVESFSAVIDKDQRLATFEVVVPKERRPEATRLEVRYAPTLVGAMLDTLPYLIEYPHGCTEQTLNRFLPAAIVRQTLGDLGVELADLKPAAPVDGPPSRPEPIYDEEELDRLVKVGVQRLMQMQLSDGGWGWFSGLGERSSAHTTAVVLRGLRVAQRSGVAVPEDVMQRGAQWLERHRAAQLERLANVDADGDVIDRDKPWKRHADNLDALVELTLGEVDRPNAKMLSRLFEDRLLLTPYNLATLGLALHLDAGRGVDESRVRRDGVIRNLRQFIQTDDEIQTAYLDLPGGGWWYWYGSEYEAHAYFLKLLAATEPNGDLAPKIVKHLLANRRHATRWNSTRDTALVVEAMADYVRASGEAAVDGTVEVWLDGQKRETRTFTVEDALRFDGRFVLAGADIDAGRHTLELRKTGPGRLYAGASLTNFSLEDDLRAAGLDVRVRRRVQKLVPIEASEADVDGRGGVFEAKVEKYRRVDVPNLGAVESGDLIEVELTITSKNDYEYLIVEDAKPAGFEPVEVRSGYNGNELGAYVEFRDETVRFYARTLARGERSVRYRLRAETPGRFAALPTQISAMYAPELRGNSDEIRVVVEDAD